jgi:hypothetical protein
VGGKLDSAFAIIGQRGQTEAIEKSHFLGCQQTAQEGEKNNSLRTMGRYL